MQARDILTALEQGESVIVTAERAQLNVGFVGVGRMGGPMCRRLMEAGNQPHHF